MSQPVPLELDIAALSAEIFGEQPQPANDQMQLDIDHPHQQPDSLDALFSHTDVSQLIHSLLQASLPPPPPATIDPTLNPSPPHSPQPSLRSDASTSQLPPQQQPKPTSLTPANIKISSLDQLANPPPGQQPNYPWWTIIRAAIMGSRYGILSRDEIYDALQRRWAYFRSTSDHATRVWKAAVGHNLSVKECFVRVHVDGQKNTSYYIVDTAVDPAKGRLSKAKNSTTAAADRMAIPTITRKLVLPAGFDLTIQARWSPAIAAIRNAKFGYPATPPQQQRAQNERRSEPESGASTTESETDSDDTATEAEPLPSTSSSRPGGSRLGSSLSAIIEPTGSRRQQPPLPRLAFSRSLSNALVAAPPPSRRHNLAARNPSSSTPARPPRPPRSSADRPLQRRAPSTPIPASPPPDFSPDFSSLQDHVNAALADVAACLPDIIPHSPEAPPEEDAGQQSMMIDCLSSIFDPLPEIDLAAILKEAQMEIQDAAASSQPPQADPLPAAAEIKVKEEEEEAASCRRRPTSTACWRLIDEAQLQPALDPGPSIDETPAAVEASLEAEIEEALLRAEAAARLDTQLTASGDIPVHPAPADIPVHPLPSEPPAPVASRTPKLPKPRPDRRAPLARPPRPAVVRPTLLRCLPHPPPRRVQRALDARPTHPRIRRAHRRPQTQPPPALRPHPPIAPRLRPRPRRRQHARARLPRRRPRRLRPQAPRHVPRAR
ncbi:hypothetical protein PTTG_08019 [Puccinia triticina 1-1 BBBD Race 1]|uniref:Fork-head domain-containing protein n=1 Tax=Puccinia triticina (isolate 1-1 / race 1 (BBBD)) TaxID=630390 RepID=A0A180GJX8_PUCT1|nr:hypothetical protein PTTG_08019 [Puccinia triticina 1-1 BBBD Race 1]